MTAQRIKGQEVSIIITRDGDLESELTDIENFNGILDLEVKSQGYLSEKTNRKDEVFNGVKFDFEMNAHSADFFDFQAAIIDRAKRNTPDVVFNIAGVFSFPSGEVRKMIYPDCKFGPMPIQVPGRGEYVKMKFEGECEDYDLQK